MKRANLTVRTEEWENEREENGKESEGEFCWSFSVYEGGEIKSNSVKYCVKYDFDRIILTQGTISTVLRPPGCGCRQRPQGGAATEGALTVKFLSPAALLIKQ